MFVIALAGGSYSLFATGEIDTIKATESESLIIQGNELVEKIKRSKTREEHDKAWSDFKDNSALRERATLAQIIAVAQSQPPSSREFLAILVYGAAHQFEIYNQPNLSIERVVAE